MSKEHTTLDYVDDIRVDADRHLNSFNVLRSLLIGMFNLAEFTRKREVTLVEAQEENTIRQVIQVNDETLMLGCVFDWFSISLVSYLRLVKLIDLMEVNKWEIAQLRDKSVRDEVKRACPMYISSVAPAVYKWRQKIAAHRAATDPRKADNLTTLTYSTMPTVSYSTPYYGVMNFRLIMGGGGPLDLEQWSLTKTFEDLAPRFWPGVRLTPLPEWATQ